MGHGAFGVEAAARMYFGKSVGDLTLPEVALLAALPRSPGNYSPFERPELAQRRRAIAVGRLLDVGYIGEADAKAANRAPLGLVAPERRRGSGRYFLEYLQQSLEAKYGSDVLYKSGLAVYTTLEPGLQRAAEQALREGLQALAARQAVRPGDQGKTPPPASTLATPEGAVVVIDAATGYVKALVGGADFARTEFNRALYAHRQPGSAFKPFVYLAALEAGRAPTEELDDSPIRYVSAGKVWAPENYDGKFRGPVTMAQALAESINVPTIRLLEQLGVNPVIDAARRSGIQSPLPPDLTLALGSGDVTLLELTAAYGTFANQGVRMEPLMVRYVTDAQGRLVEENVPQGREAIDPAVANGLTQMLRGVVEHGTGVAARVLERPVAGKTGTTNDFSNAWFVGYTPSIVAGVWVGHDRPRSLGYEETGARAALPIWVAVMRAALRGQPVEEFPAAPTPPGEPRP
jgi:penicillin-binding protein 1A